MADETREPTDADADAAAEEYAKQLRAVLPDDHDAAVSCPGCGSDDGWAFRDVALQIIVGRDPATGAVEELAGSVHAIAATCAKCGLVSLYDRDVIGG